MLIKKITTINNTIYDVHSYWKDGIELSIKLGWMEEIPLAADHKLIHLGIGHVTIQPEDETHPNDKAVLCRNDYPQYHKH